MKLVKRIVSAIILSIIVYYVPSLFIEFRASTVGIEYETPAAAVVVSQTDKETLRVFAENLTKNITTESNIEKDATQASGLGEYPQIFVYNIVISIITATIVSAIVKRIYK